MPRKSTNVDKMPKFQSEAEEAEWYHTPEGKRYVSRKFRDAMQKGVIESDARTLEERRAAHEQAGGRAIHFKHGLNVKRTDPAVLQRLLDEARASMTRAVSLRIPIADLDAAKRIAERTGQGYQTVLKQIISDGLRRAS